MAAKILQADEFALEAEQQGHSHAGHRHGQDRAGKLGSWMSLVCSIHCMLTPIITTALPFAGARFLADERLEAFFLGGSILLALYLMIKDYRQHHNAQPLIILGGAIVLYASAHVLADSNLGHAILSVLGGLTMFLAFMRNRKLGSC